MVHPRSRTQPPGALERLQDMQEARRGAARLAPHEVGADHHDVAPAAAPAHVIRARLVVVHIACAGAQA